MSGLSWCAGQGGRGGGGLTGRGSSWRVRRACRMPLRRRRWGWRLSRCRSGGASSRGAGWAGWGARRRGGGPKAGWAGGGAGGGSRAGGDGGGGEPPPPGGGGEGGGGEKGGYG